MHSSYSVNTTIPVVLQKLTDETLHSKLLELTSRERKLTTHILWHMAEVDRRKLYLQMAFPSFFEYLVKGLGYAPASAQRRIDASRLLAQLSQTESQQVAQKIEDGELNLSQISKLQGFSRQARKETGKTVSPEQKSQILQRIENQSLFTTEKVIAQALDVKPQQPTRTHIQQDDSVRVELTFTAEEMTWIQQAQDLLSNATGGGLKETLAHLAKTLVSKEQQARSKAVNSATSQPPYFNPSKSGAASSKARRQVFQRDQCCQYKDPKTGVQCGSRKFLSVDHIQPQFAHGNNDPQNLRIYCRSHNTYRYQAENGVRRSA
ncbi:MAG: HNH endonuclease [Pseudobdellovibrionaceae bacterium]